MQSIQKDSAVTLRYRIFDGTGKLLEDSKEPVAYLHGGYGNLLPKVEAALQGREAGYETTVALDPDDAFGGRDESLVRTIPKAQFPPGVKVGGQLTGTTDDGREHTFHVVKIKGPEVLLDGNHPLAGKALRFAVKVLSVRAATQEELAHGHVHGAHGHHH